MMEVMHQNHVNVCNSLNELISEMKKNFITVEHNFSSLGCNGKTIHRKKKLPKFDQDFSTATLNLPRTRKLNGLIQRKMSLPIALPDAIMEVKAEPKEEHNVVDKLNNLMEELETSFLSLSQPNESSVLLDVADLLPDSTNGGIEDERYVLDDFKRYMAKKLASGPRRRRCSDSSINEMKKVSEFSADMLHTIEHHSTLCRRLKTLEASYGITLKKELHFFVKKKMKLMNVSGCVFCMYAFYVSKISVVTCSNEFLSIMLCYVDTVGPECVCYEYVERGFCVPLFRKVAVN